MLVLETVIYFYTSDGVENIFVHNVTVRYSGTKISAKLEKTFPL